MHAFALVTRFVSMMVLRVGFRATPGVMVYVDRLEGTLKHTHKGARRGHMQQIYFVQAD